MPRHAKPCQIPGCERPRPGDLRTCWTRSSGAKTVKIAVCPWCLLRGTPESRKIQRFDAGGTVRRGPHRIQAGVRVRKWLQVHGYSLERPPPAGSGRKPEKPPVDPARLQAWLQDQGLELRPAAPDGNPTKPSAPSTSPPAPAAVDFHNPRLVGVDLDVERTPEEAQRDGLIEPHAHGRGYSATAKGRFAIAALRLRDPPMGPEAIRRRLGLGKATVWAIIRQLEASA